MPDSKEATLYSGLLLQLCLSSLVNLTVCTTVLLAKLSKQLVSLVFASYPRLFLYGVEQ